MVLICFDWFCPKTGSVPIPGFRLRKTDLGFSLDDPGQSPSEGMRDPFKSDAQISSKQSEACWNHFE